MISIIRDKIFDDQKVLLNALCSICSYNKPYIHKTTYCHKKHHYCNECLQKYRKRINCSVCRKYIVK